LGFAASKLIAAPRHFSCTRQAQYFDITFSLAYATAAASHQSSEDREFESEIAEKRLRFDCACKFSYADRIELIDASRALPAWRRHQLRTPPARMR
jgi:hypothetical protein